MIGNTSLAEKKVVEVRKQLFNDGPKATPGHDMISGTNGDICPRLSVRNEWKKRYTSYLCKSVKMCGRRFRSDMRPTSALG